MFRRTVHETITRVTEDIERDFHFNTAISAVMELVNALYAFEPTSLDAVAAPERPLPWDGRAVRGRRPGRSLTRLAAQSFGPSRPFRNAPDTIRSTRR